MFKLFRTATSCWVKANSIESSMRVMSHLQLTLPSRTQQAQYTPSPPSPVSLPTSLLSSLQPTCYIPPTQQTPFPSIPTQPKRHSRPTSPPPLASYPRLQRARLGTAYPKSASSSASGGAAAALAP